LNDRGITQPLLDAITDALDVSPGDIVLDAGCGEGFYLGGLVQKIGCQGHGVDISARAIDLAARRYPQCQWVVANADRFLPYADSSFSIVLSITGRMNRSEFRRVLRDDGRLLVGVASPDDLVELRGVGRDRVARTLDSFTPAFTLAGQSRVTIAVDLD